MLHDDVGVGVPIQPPSVTLHAAYTPRAQTPPCVPWHGAAGGGQSGEWMQSVEHTGPTLWSIIQSSMSTLAIRPTVIATFD